MHTCKYVLQHSLVSAYTLWDYRIPRLLSRTRALKCKTLGGNHIHHALSHIEQQASIHTMVIDRLCIYCACACECLAAPSRTSPVSRLFHAG